jgi:hypothetical protein
MENQMEQTVAVTFTVGEWAKIVASIATSRLDLHEKDVLNSHIYDCVTQRAA